MAASGSHRRRRRSVPAQPRCSGRALKIGAASVCGFPPYPTFFLACGVATVKALLWVLLAVVELQHNFALVVAPVSDCRSVCPIQIDDVRLPLGYRA